MQDVVAGRDDPELVPDAHAAVRARVAVEEVVLGVVRLLSAVFGADDLGDEALVVRADVAEALNFALVAEGLGSAFRRPGDLGRLDPGDLRGLLDEAASLQLRLLSDGRRETRDTCG